MAFSLGWLRSMPRLLPAALAIACSDADGPSPAPSCDAVCQDETALRGLRESMKLVYNLTLQGRPVGEQDESARCPMGGSARVYGAASSDALQGATRVALTYEFEACAYLQRDDEAEESYDLVVDGAVSQEGVLAVQPTATTALLIAADAVSIVGNVFDPAIDYAEPACALRISQDGNRISGTWCERELGFDL